MAYRENRAQDPIINVVKFYPSRMMGNFDRAAQPIWIDGAGVTATDSIGDSVADGGHPTDLIDIQQKTRLNVNVSGDTDAAYRTELTLDEAITNNFMVVDNSTLRSAYPDSITNLIDVYYDSDATFSGATKITPNSVHSSIIGRQEPLLSFDGIDDVVTVADDPNLDFGFGDGAISIKVVINDLSEDVYFYSRTQDGSNQLFFRWFKSSSLLWMGIDVGGVSVHSALASWSPIVGTEYNIVYSFVNGVSNLLSVDGEILTLSGDTHTGGDISITADMVLANRSTDYSEIDIKEVIIYNRALAPKELERMALGVPVPKPLIVGNSSSMETIGGYVPLGSSTLTGGYDSGDSDHGSTLRIEAADTFNEAATVSLLESVVAGKRYKLELDYKYINITGLSGNEILALLTTTGGETIITVTPAVDGWHTISATFTATETNAKLQLNANYTTGGNASNEVLFDNVYLTDLDTLVTFPLEADKWGSQTELMPNQVDRDFSGPSAWTNGTLAAYDETGDLSITANAVGQFCDLPAASAPMTPGDRYRLTYDVENLVSTWKITDRTGSQIFGVVDSAGANKSFEFTLESGKDGGIGIISLASDSSANFDNFSLVKLGALASYTPNGISDKWYDESTNDLDGTITGATSVNLPTVVNGEGDFTLIEFNDLTKQYWFWNFNEGEEISTSNNVFFGQIGLGKSFDPAFNPSISFTQESAYGISSSQSVAGRRSTSKKFGKRRMWDFTWELLTEAQLEGFQELFDTVEVSEGLSHYATWFTTNSGENDTIYWYGRLSGIPVITPMTHGIFALSMRIETEV